MNSRQRQALYFALAVVGLIGCWYFNLQWMNSKTLPQGGSGFVELMFANSASSSISWDLIFGSLPLFAFIIFEGRRLGMKRPWLYVLAGFVTAFAFICPLFLGLRERHMEQAAANSAK